MTNAAPAALTNQAAIPSTEIAPQAEAALASLRALETETTADQTVAPIDSELPAVTTEIGARSEEDARILSYSTSLELFTRLEGAWRDLSQELAGWNRSLTRRARQLQASAAHLEQLQQTWEQTRAQADKLPPALSQRVDSVLAEIKRAHDQEQEQLSVVLTLQNRVTEQTARVQEAVGAISEARQQLMRHLLVRDAPPIWSPNLRAGVEGLTVQGHHSLSRQWSALTAYWTRKRERFLLQAVVFICLLVALFRARTRLKGLDGAQEHLARSMHSLGDPLPGSLLIALLLSPWLYPQAPRLLWSMLGTFALIPAIVLLRRVVVRQWFGILNALVAFFLVDQLRSVAASQPLLWRLLFVAEMAAATVYCLVLLRSDRRAPTPEARLGPGLRAGLQIALSLFGATFLANLVGYGRLSGLIGSLLLSAAYLALILYAVIRVADVLLRALLLLSPLARLALVQHHHFTLAHWFRRTLQWVALGLWLLYVLERLALRTTVLDGFSQVAGTAIHIGSLNFTLGHVFLFALTLWAAYLLSRFLRFILEEEVYPHVRLAPGLHYSISRTLHYVVLLVGFLLGLAMLGFNLTKLTILAGAFGVGLGFGLQNIVNNFVSGIILLFERPVKVGDVIQLDSTEGVVQRIGIRASIVRTLGGSEIIIPNAKLISDPVTNWTFSQRGRLLTVPVTVASEAEPRRVIEVLRRVAGTHPQVAKEPPAQALLINVSNGTANFELRAWTERVEDWQQVRSDLFIAIRSSLAAEKIPVH